MPINVPTQDEHAALDNEVGQLSLSLAALDARVTALEQAATRPPIDWPDRPPPDGGQPAAGIVTVHMGGTDYVYDPATGEGLSDYFDPDHRFVMSNTRVRLDGCPLVLDFRETGGVPEWRCVVFEYSDPLNGSCPNLTYTATIQRNGSGPLVIDIPDHYANASWRWQSCPWPHPLTPLETLYERRLLPRHDAALACGKAGNLSTLVEAPPLSLCGFTGEMGMTGGRADIGVVTGWQAEWMCLQVPEMLKTVLLQGEAAFPWRWRDKDTGAILDVIKQYPKASMHWGNGPSGQPQVYFGTGPHPGLDAAHCPSCYYVPYLLTGDPYYLEYLHGETMYCFAEAPRNDTTVVGSEQIRGVAWSLRNLFHSALVTPDDVPSWIVPKQIFVDELERQRGLLADRQSDGYPYRSFAHIIDSYGRWEHAWWQHDYATAVVAWISMHDDRWVQQRDYMVEGVAGRNDPTSGWCVGYPTSYWTNTTNKFDYFPEGSFKSWSEAWDWNANNKYADTPVPCPALEVALSKNETYDYFSAMMHCLRLASQAGSEPAKPVLQRLTAAWEQGLRAVGYTELKYCASP